MWTICEGWGKNCNHNVVKREVHGKKLEHEHKKGIGGSESQVNILLVKPKTKGPWQVL